MVFCYQNCSDLRPTVRKNCSSDQEKLRLRSLEQFIQTVKGQNNFLVTKCFFNFSHVSNKLEQLEFKLQKLIGI